MNRIWRCFFPILISAVIGCQDQLVTISGPTMGTTFQVKIVQSEITLDVKVLSKEVSARLEEVNRQMSTYQDDSEITQFNRSPSTDWFAVSSDFAYVLHIAREISTWSDGAFDVTIGPLVNLWGFGPNAIPERVPPPDSIQAHRALVGYEKIHIDLSAPTIKKEIPEIYCDLSAIAKGFGVDRIASYLDSLGINHYFIEIGGELRTKGHNHLRQLWRIGIASPAGQGELQKALALDNISMATSGDYHNYFERDGIRYSHTIDPRTGRPITHALASVTVLHKSCAYADGLATAINVMGPEKGFAFAEKHNLVVFMIVRHGDGFVEKMTSNFGALLK
ncbi:MAG: FAD:protein FMN transferase [Gemmatimonadota bacterium]|nr:FAD:protein FMN transferase [Gemmatimonadota bacterium]